jgi:hypothetical protein
MACLPCAHRAAAAVQAAVLVLARWARGVVALLGHTRGLVLADQGINLLLPGGIGGPVRSEPMNR